mgnify:CR=1 FL=1
MTKGYKLNIIVIIIIVVVVGQKKFREAIYNLSSNKGCLLFLNSPYKNIRNKVSM